MGRNRVFSLYWWAVYTHTHTHRQTQKWANSKGSLSSLLFGDTNGSSLSARGLRVLTSHSHSPLMSQPSMTSDFLEPLEIITELGVEGGGDDLGKFSVFDVLLSIEKPIWDLILLGMLDNSHQALDLIGRKLTGSLVHINV